MSKKPLLYLVVGLIIVAGLVWFFAYDNSVDAPNNNASNNPPAAASDQVAEKTGVIGTYTNYSASAVASDNGTKILFFHAPWCPQCRALDAEIKVNKLPEGTTIYKVDYDTNQSLRQKYGVTIQTTFVKIDDNGNLVKRYVAYEEPNFSALSKNIL